MEKQTPYKSEYCMAQNLTGENFDEWHLENFNKKN